MGLDVVILICVGLLIALMIAAYLLLVSNRVTKTPLLMISGEPVIVRYPDGSWHLCLGLRNAGTVKARLRRIVVHGVTAVTLNQEVPAGADVFLDVSLGTASIEEGKMYEAVLIYDGGTLSFRAYALASEASAGS